MNSYLKTITALTICAFISGCAATNTPTNNNIKDTTKQEQYQEKINEKIENKEQIDKKEQKEQEIKSAEKEQKEEQVKIIKQIVKKIIIKKPVIKDSMIVIGTAEKVYIPSSDILLKAKIDTGATTTSIHALNIKEFERDGNKWIKFDLQDKDGNLINKNLPLHRIVKIKRHGTKNQKRYVVQMKINLANISQLVEVSLTNRSKFTYPVLIGKNYLNGLFLVDVSKKYITKPKMSKNEIKK
ncbi:ATP-dependent zinc protease [Malaciobacter canalis]|uniref:ATP-dependent zinc protease family protein n=1 Tax=Malaciobacter canalis TaxID=1912871 RepID=UPI00384F22BD